VLLGPPIISSSPYYNILFSHFEIVTALIHRSEADEVIEIKNRTRKLHINGGTVIVCRYFSQLKPVVFEFINESVYVLIAIRHGFSWYIIFSARKRDFTMNGFSTNRIGTERNTGPARHHVI